VFVFDTRLLGGPQQGPPRVRFLVDCVERLAGELAGRGCPLIVRQGDPRRVLPELAQLARVERVTWNRDYSPYAHARDTAVTRALERTGRRVDTFKDRVVFESGEIRNASGGPYSVYTPYRRAWLQRFRHDPPPVAGPLRLPPGVPGIEQGTIPSLAALGADKDRAEIPTGGARAARDRLRRFLETSVRDYARQRDLPALDGTSRLSAHLRFGTISVRGCIEEALSCAEVDTRAAPGAGKWVDELVWREFYHSILAEHPHVMRGAFRPEYDALEWDEDSEGFAAWCAGETGFPFVDAAMRQLARTGWMHNRARMVVASFLTKDLGIDWQRGERFFMQRLVDGDPASNNGGWQWAASTGTDAQPWFRIFNPVAQGERFDPEAVYVHRWVPELRGLDAKSAHRPWDSPVLARGYPPPILDHAERRRRALRRFEAIRRRKSAAPKPDGRRRRAR
jgi:deoxyribodipyrimidine photo-lyase